MKILTDVKSSKLHTKLKAINLYSKFFSLIILIFSFTHGAFRYAQFIENGGDSWTTGEWLINYEGGFVRRGVIGQIFLKVTPEGQISLWILFICQLLVCFFLLIFCMYQLKLKNYSWGSVAIYCNPAGIAFIGWDPYGFGRKEYIGITVLLLLSLLHRDRFSNFNLIILLVLNILFIFSIFSSEINFIFLPMYLYIQSLYLQKSKYLLSTQIFTSIFSLTVLLICILHDGKGNQNSQICESLIAHGLKANLCDGAISYIGTTAKSQVLFVLHQYPSYSAFFLLLFITLIPFILTDWGKKNRSFVIACFLVSAPLYVIAVDYGRWISMLIIGITICYSSSLIVRNELDRINPWVIIIFVSIWKIPHSGMEILEIPKGFFYLVSRFIYTLALQ